MKKKREEITNVLKPVVKSMGYEYVGSEFQAGGAPTLTLFIDKKEGVSTDDCAIVSRQVSAVLDVEGLISGKYRLEVSSPGLDRPLFSLADFERFLGETVSIRLHRPIEGRRNFQGMIVRIEQESIVIQCDHESFTLLMNDIAKANLVPKF